MNARLLMFAIILLVSISLIAHAQQFRTVPYQGVVKKAGALYSGEAVFLFTFYSGNRAEWTSTESSLHVSDGLFQTFLGPFPNDFRFDRIDSLGVSFDGTELTPRIPFGPVAFSLSAYHALVADSATNPGPKGDKGDLGLQGDQGLKGDKGDKGDPGLEGVQGAKGERGEKGDQGLPGGQGFKGDKGERGDLGTKGDKGDRGDFGLKGDKGDRGDFGLKGDKGDRGDFGLKGDKGDRGDRGDKGDFGDRGPDGPQGFKGDKGDKGDQGGLGPQGNQGLKGERGDKGDRGDRGDRGDFGLKGDKGDRGLNLTPVGSLDATNGSPVCLLSTGSGAEEGSVAVVRTGSAASFRLVVSANATDDCPFSAEWHVVSGGTMTMETANDVATSLESKTIDVGTSRRCSMLFRFGSKWAKLDLFRKNSSDVKWYGFLSTN